MKKLLILLPLLLMLLIPVAVSASTSINTPSEDQLEAMAKKAGFAPESVRDTITAIALASGILVTQDDFNRAFKQTDDGEDFSGFQVWRDGFFLQFINEDHPVIHGCAKVVAMGYELYPVNHLIHDRDGDVNQLIPHLWKKFHVRVGYARKPVSRLFCIG